MPARARSLVRSRWPELGIFLLALVLRLGYWSVKGTWRGGDFGGYRATCPLWFGDPLAALAAHKGVFYAGFTLPFCTYRRIPGTTLDGWVAIQILFSAAACLVLVRAGSLLVDRRAGLAAGFTLAILWDTWLWTTLLYSTATFTLAMVVCLWAWARYDTTGAVRDRLVLVSAFGFLAVSQPFGAPIVVGWILHEVRAPATTWGRRIFESRVIPVALAISSVGLLPYAARRYGILSRLNDGQVVANDPTYRVAVEPADSIFEFVVANGLDALLVPVARVALFFVPFFPRNSAARIGLNLVTYTPVLIVATYGAYRAWHDRPDLVRYLVTPTVVMLCITAIMFVSWDLRYRSVLGPTIALLAGFALSRSAITDRIVDRVRGATDGVTIANG